MCQDTVPENVPTEGDQNPETDQDGQAEGGDPAATESPEPEGGGE